MMLYLTFIKHLLIHLGNSGNLNLSSETIPKLPTKLGNQISAYVPGRFAKISRNNSHDSNSLDKPKHPFRFKWGVYFESDINRIW